MVIWLIKRNNVNKICNKYILFSTFHDFLIFNDLQLP